jgi:hypothetical protein
MTGSLAVPEAGRPAGIGRPAAATTPTIQITKTATAMLRICRKYFSLGVSTGLELGGDVDATS